MGSLASCAVAARAAQVNGVFNALDDGQDAGMWTLLIVLLVVWAGLSILGFVVKGLLWLAIIGLILFLVTLAVGFFRQRSSRG
ncbi:hypothetical protein [Microbacterium sp. A94]|uniref:hypothetical protein n=1 Tax=Microbacterium sp. A94 TaxID=3450717 RepID=UPI003F4327EC